MKYKHKSGGFKLSATALLLSAAISSTAFGDTGSLSIRVTDESGNPVVGASVRAQTLHSLTIKSGVSNANGEIRLIGLDPSTAYEVTIKGSAYQAIRDQNVSVVSGKNFKLNYTLDTAAGNIQESVVNAGGIERIIDTSSALISTDLTLDITESLPTGRSYQSYLQLAPSTKPALNGNPASKSGVNYSPLADSNGNTAGNSTDNVYFLDGVNVTDNYSGTFGANFNAEIIQQQQILSGGIPAEYEGGQGLISRVISKSGGNEWHGSFNYSMQSDGLIADNENFQAGALSSFDTGFTVGGPIIKDKLWLFASVQSMRGEQDIVDPQSNDLLRTVKSEQDFAFAKLTWQPTEADRLVAEFFNDPQERDGSDRYDILANRDEAQKRGGDNYKFSYTHSWDNLSISLDLAQHEGEQSTYAVDPTSRNDVVFLDYAASSAETDLGGSGYNQMDLRNKDQQTITVEYFLDSNYGSHTIKSGYSETQNERFFDAYYSGDGAQYTSLNTQNLGANLESYISNNWLSSSAEIIDAMATNSNSAYFLNLLDSDNSGEISYAELDALTFNSTAGNPSGMVNVYRINETQRAPLSVRTEGNAFYIQDSWNINANWTVNAGVRAEQWAHYASDGSKVFTFERDWAPRLSVVYDIFGDGRSKVWGFSGRYYDPIRTDMTAFAGNLSSSVREEQVFVGDQWLTVNSRGGSREPSAIFAPTIKTPYTDEIVIGYEQALNTDISFQITYTERVTEDIMEDYSLDIYTDPDTVGDFALPLSYFGFETLPSAPFALATLAGAKREYKGVEATLRKRKGLDRWQGMLSYSYNDASGNSNSDGNAEYQGDFVYLDPRAPNVQGSQPGNIEHLFKAFGSYSFDNGIEVGAIYNWNSGLVYSSTSARGSRHFPQRVDDAYEFANTTARWLAPGQVGSQSSESYGTLDVRAKYDMEIAGYNTEFFVDIFNLLDDQAVTREQDLFNGDGVTNFGEANLWVSPRRFYLGMRVSF
ncbi:MAG: TonB-dependent receptor [SAR86 cluster bacterium]|uniref:TonB-dependent receptor n=1 Tax=SAR86 cluster bacterium TaxID=2030880 RepID=A0A2A4MTD4_9GAMM|nr:MAG: TonB-dependent receptor [SAR86 cluster bacterium]